MTGRNTYWIDENGLIYSDDIKGKDLQASPIKLKEQDQTKTLLETVGNELAGDLARVAEKAFKNSEYTRCKRIITNIRKRFPQSPAAKQLNTLEKNATPFIVEYKSKELYERAEALIKGKKLDAAITTMRNLVKQYPGSSIAGEARKKLTELTESRAWQDMDLAEKYMREKQADRALATLKGISKKYPEAILIAKLKDRMALCETQVMKMLEEEVADVLEQAHKLEAENKYEEAYILYLTIKNRYKETHAAKGIDEVLAKNRKMISEQAATRLIEEILELKPETNAPRILSLIELLGRSYSQTDSFKNNQKTLERLNHETQAYKYITAAREQLRNESYRAALANLELAIKEDPGIQVTMKEELEQCYLFLADAAYENQDYEQALDYYQHYILLQPKYSRINERKLMECHFQQAKAAFQNEKYADGEKHLLACAEQYGNDSEYNFIYGRILMNMSRWEEAVPRFSSSITVDAPFAREARLYWALAQYRHALNEEENLRKMLYEDDELKRVITSYGIKFDVTARTNILGNLYVADIKKSSAKTFAELTSALCAQLDDLANDAERLVHIDKEKTDQKLTQRTKIRTRIQELPNTLSVMRAYQSADVYRKIRISEQLTKVRKLYLTLNQALTGISSKKRTPEMAKVISSLLEKVSELRSAEESFDLYAGLEEQRQRTAVSILENFSDRLSANSANASVLKKNADELRDLYTSVKETELAVSALRNIAKAYALIPPMSSIILTEPSTADKADKVIPVESTAGSVRNGKKK
jgi:outer membrane protein assembly factor BamD (BamD/ComL family)